MARNHDPQDLIHHLSLVGGSDDDAHHYSLGWLQEHWEQSHGPLIELLKTAPSEFTRSRCATALTSMPGAEVQAALLHALEHDASPLVRETAVVGLRDIDDTSTVPVFMMRLGDSNVIVRRWCADILGRLGDARAIPRLKQALQNKDAWVAFHAAEALRQWQVPEARAKLEHLREHALDSAIQRCAKQVLFEWDRG